MSWDKEIEETGKRRALAAAMGGEEGIEKQHARGKLTVRERIDYLLDPGSFREHGRLAGGAILDDQGEIVSFTPANYVVGFGRIDGRQIVVGGEDFTLKGGSPNAAGLRKSIYAEHLAVKHRTPLVRLLEGGGGSVSTGDDDPRKPRTVGEPVYAAPRFAIIAEAMGLVPVASAALGPVAGFPAGRLVASHFSVMARGTAQVMIGGPALVKRALGRDLSKEELGGVAVHAKSGVVDNIADDEGAALDQIRRFLSYMPQSVWHRAPRIKSSDPSDRCEDELASIVPRNRRHAFDMDVLIKLVVDRDSFFPIASAYGPGLIVGFARLQGQAIGVTGNDCRHLAGAMTAEAAQKMRRMIEICDTFHLPLVNFVDEPGFMIGPEAESAATIRYGMAAVSAAAQAKIPWASVRVRKSFGVAAAAHFGPDAYVLDWPSAESGPLPLEGGVAVAFGREIASAADPAAKRLELEEKLAKARSPYRAAESFATHEMIDPRETRPLLCDWIEWNETRLDGLLGPSGFPMRP
ncbi:MAG: propionyl-CoA carboxylase [Gammaproteobacteria bacterium]|nr:propionyl-CoA carboxylase [Gammaproteobacteria bacterium]